MSKTSNALEIMNHLFGHDADTLARLEEERVKSLAAMALYDARIAACLTQRQLAECANVEEAAIAQLEEADYNGHTFATLNRIAASLGQRVEIRFVTMKTNDDTLPLAAEDETADAHLATRLCDLEARVQKLTEILHEYRTSAAIEASGQ